MNSLAFDLKNPPPLFDVGAAWSTLWDRRNLVVGITVLAIAAAGAYLVVTKPSYTASSALLVDPRDLKTTNIEGVLPGIGADSAAIASQVSVIESRELLQQVFADLGLASDPEYAGSGGLGSLFGGGKAPSPEVVFQRFQSSVSVEREGLTYVIDVNVKSHDAARAAQIANAIVDRYIQSASAETSTANADVTQTLNTKIASLQSDLATAEQAVNRFKADNHIYDATTGGTLQSQIDQLSTQVLAAEDALSQAQARVDQAKAAGASPQGLVALAAISSSTAIDKLRADYNDRTAALASAEAIYGPRHPTVIAARAELGKVTALIAREAARIGQQLNADRDLAAGNLKKLQQSLQALRAQADQSNTAEVQLRQLQRKADAAQAVLNDFLQRSQQTSQLTGLQDSQIKVISRAAAPPDPTWPKPMLLLPVSAVFGLLLGCGVALLLGERRPVVEPTPVTPNRPRRQPAKPQPNPASVSAARRFAGLDAARREMTGGRDTALTAAVQRLLRQVLAALPNYPKPYLLAFSSPDDELAAAGAELVALGLEHIGGKVLVLAEANAGLPEIEDYDFILIPGSAALRSQADLDIAVVVPPTEPPAGQLALVLETEPVRPRIAAASGRASLRPTG